MADAARQARQPRGAGPGGPQARLGRRGQDPGGDLGRQARDQHAAAGARRLDPPPARTARLARAARAAGADGLGDQVPGDLRRTARSGATTGSAARRPRTPVRSRSPTTTRPPTARRASCSASSRARRRASGRSARSPRGRRRSSRASSATSGPGADRAERLHGEVLGRGPLDPGLLRRRHAARRPDRLPRRDPRARRRDALRRHRERDRVGRATWTARSSRAGAPPARSTPRSELRFSRAGRAARPSAFTGL